MSEMNWPGIWEEARKAMTGEISWDELEQWTGKTENLIRCLPSGKVSKASVNYRPAAQRSNGGKRCGSCSMFRAPAGCTLVAGVIRRGDVCDRWAPKAGKPA